MSNLGKPFLKSNKIKLHKLKISSEEVNELLAIRLDHLHMDPHATLNKVEKELALFATVLEAYKYEYIPSANYSELAHIHTKLLRLWEYVLRSIPYNHLAVQKWSSKVPLEAMFKNEEGGAVWISGFSDLALMQNSIALQVLLENLQEEGCSISQEQVGWYLDVVKLLIEVKYPAFFHLLEDGTIQEEPCKIASMAAKSQLVAQLVTRKKQTGLSTAMMGILMDGVTAQLMILLAGADDVVLALPRATNSKEAAVQMLLPLVFAASELSSFFGATYSARNKTISTGACKIASRSRYSDDHIGPNRSGLENCTEKSSNSSSSSSDDDSVWSGEEDCSYQPRSCHIIPITLNDRNSDGTVSDLSSLDSIDSCYNEAI